MAYVYDATRELNTLCLVFCFETGNLSTNILQRMLCMPVRFGETVHGYVSGETGEGWDLM